MMGEVIRVSGRAPDVGDLLREAMVSQRFADVALCCSGGQRFLAHRLVLSAASPYLQDVLLAHGKVAGYSEPITIILAEVEGPELSAILGFVYTGSATIPKSRLEAFKRAAATLRVTIPSLSSSSSTSEFINNETLTSHSDNHHDHLNLDNVKIEETTRIDGKIINNNNDTVGYHRCEQYPSYDGWFNSSSWHLNADCTTERHYQPDEWIIRTRNDPGLSRSSTRRSSHDEIAKFHAVPIKTIGASETGKSFVDNEKKIRRIDYNDKNTFRNTISCYDDGIINRDDSAEEKEFSRASDRWENRSRIRRSYDAFQQTGSLDNRDDKRNYVYPSVEFRRELRNFHVDKCPVDSYFATDNFPSRIDGKNEKQVEEERQEGDERSNRVDNDFDGSRDEERGMLSSLVSYSTTGRSSATFDKPDYDYGPSIPYDNNCPSSPLAIGNKLISETAIISSTVTSEFSANFAGPSLLARTTGTDDLCAESCCRWRTPVRRHVANRVPASPWCQLARPAHHSPKTRPLVLRNREEESFEAPSNDNWNNTIKLGENLTNLYPSASMAYIDNKIENSSSLSLNVDVNKDSPGSMYGYQVPKTLENPSTLEETLNHTKQPRSPIYHEEKPDNNSSVLSATSISSLKQFPSVIKSTEILRAMEKPLTIRDIVQDSSQLHRHIDRASNIIVNHEQSRVRLSQHAVSPEATTNKQIINDPSTCNPKVSSRIELSHPVSRLCDSIRKTDQPLSRDAFFTGKNREKSTTINSSTMTTREIQTKDNDSSNLRGKTIFSVSGGIVHSDDNNNEAEIDESVINNVINLDVNARIDGEDESINNEEHKCDQCGKTFVTRASLKVHGRTHSGEKPFRCSDCGKEFSQLRNYKYHRSVHEGTREFAATCPECGKYFNDRGYLSSHMKIHRNRKEYGCTECGKSFNQRVAYNMHVRIHTGIKPHQCEQCGKAFSRKMLLKQHLRTHSGERPYQCQICHKAFADRSNMTLHTRLHSGLKPYQCTLCSKAFTKKHHLKTHLNYHTGTKPYSCPNCSLRFSQSSNMRTHYKKCCSVEVDSSKRENPRGRSKERSTAPPGEGQAAVRIAVAPSVGAGRTNALTPPNSDQESSINTPIKINDATLNSNSRGINANKDSNDVSDT